MINKTSQVSFFIFAFVLMSGLTFVKPIPPGPIGPYLDGIFSSTPPGKEGSWELVEWEAYPEGLPSAVKVLPFPNSDDILILCKIGELHKIALDGSQSTKILDIKDRTFKKGEGGSVGMALHPHFGDVQYPDDQLIFIFYRWKPNPNEWSELGFNRLSKFKWDAVNNRFDPSSEEILIQQFDRATWHNGGGMFFKPDGFLYLSLGDEGFEDHIADSSQRLNGGLFSGVIRIDIDNDLTKSHPIRRQPIPNAESPEGWGDTYSQGYSIPNDNPWIDESGEILEEYFCVGIRSPFSMIYDEVLDKIWLSDVGFKSREEINIIERGMNYEWPLKEGELEHPEFSIPNDQIGEFKAPYYYYDRTIGSCIIGGNVYRGLEFPELNEKYLFADFINNRIMALTNSGEDEEPEFEILLNNLWSQPIDLPEKPGIIGVHPLPDGTVLVTVTGEAFEEPTKLLKLKRKTNVPDPPAKLSDLNVFTNLSALSVRDGIIPYTVNSPLWSDGAFKKRWVALPNNGSFDDKSEQILFQEFNPWEFPEGTVFIKHFELPKNPHESDQTYRLETRFFIVGAGGKGYGLTYKWNEEGSDAILLGGGTTKTFTLKDEFGSEYQQTWNYPSRTQCLTCHNDNANYILGFNTHQLNGEFYYKHLGKEMNQLKFLNELDIFKKDIGTHAQYYKSYAIEDKSVSLEKRIKSYIDANCASCHRNGGIPKISMDLRYSQLLRLQNTINSEVESQASEEGSLIIKPGSHEESEFWRRDASLIDGKMPPLGRNLVDEIYVDSLAKWIDGLEEMTDYYHQIISFPNPSEGLMTIVLSEAFDFPTEVKIYTVSGRSIFQQIIMKKQFNLDLTQYPAGTYMMVLESKNEKQTKKIVLI